MSLFRRDILHLLKHGADTESRETFFIRTISEEAHQIARQFGAEIRTIMHLRLLQAQDYWHRDILRLQETIRQTDPDTLPEPDEFKQAAFLAYWLRRRMVVDRVQADDIDLVRYMNEIVAFLIGFRICHFHQAIRPDIVGEEAKRRIRQFRLHEDYVWELAIFLHHKNVSPHALYLIYKSLFHTAIPPVHDSPNITPA